MEDQPGYACDESQQGRGCIQRENKEREAMRRRGDGAMAYMQRDDGIYAEGAPRPQPPSFAYASPLFTSKQKGKLSTY